MTLRDRAKAGLPLRLCLALLTAGVLGAPAAARPPTASVAAPTVDGMARRIVETDDNGGLPFAVVDKVGARVVVFDADGAPVGRTAALLGAARGDRSVPGIGDRSLAEIAPADRTTPAGRFEAVLGRNLEGREVLWVDYDTAVSLHPVVTNNPAERRPQRLASPTAADNRISYGCINVPAAFFRGVVKPTFADGGVVYVLPEVAPMRRVFGRLGG